MRNKENSPLGKNKKNALEYVKHKCYFKMKMIRLTITFQLKPFSQLYGS